MACTVAACIMLETTVPCPWVLGWRAIALQALAVLALVLVPVEVQVDAAAEHLVVVLAGAAAEVEDAAVGAVGVVEVVARAVSYHGEKLDVMVLELDYGELEDEGGRDTPFFICLLLELALR